MARCFQETPFEEGEGSPLHVCHPFGLRSWYGICRIAWPWHLTSSSSLGVWKQVHEQCQVLGPKPVNWAEIKLFAWLGMQTLVGSLIVRHSQKPYPDAILLLVAAIGYVMWSLLPPLGFQAFQSRMRVTPIHTASSRQGITRTCRCYKDESPLKALKTKVVMRYILPGSATITKTVALFSWPLVS